jgi:tetratricopeptide (TPR) repeat protein
MPNEDEARVLRDLFERAKALNDVPDKDVHVVELLSAYVRLKPDKGIAWFYLGDALRTSGRLQEAERALRTAVDLAPKARRFAVYARIAMVMTERGSPLDAEKWFRLSTAESRCPGWIWCLRGVNLRRTEEYGLAKTCLEAALVSDDAVKEEVFLNLALMARAQRKYAEARDYAREALTLDPTYPEAKRVLESLVGIEETVESAASLLEGLRATGGGPLIA